MAEITESIPQEEQPSQLPTLQAPRHRSSKTPEELALQEEIDSRSVYIGNVDYETTANELQAHFNNYGMINRVTILFDKYTGYPKGYAYLEYEDKESVAKAVENLNNSQFKNRTISVVAKRTNLPGFKRGSFRGRGRGGRGSFRGRGGRGGAKGGAYKGGARQAQQAGETTAEQQSQTADPVASE